MLRSRFTVRPFNFLKRASAWKAYVQGAIIDIGRRIDRAEVDTKVLAAEIAQVASRLVDIERGSAELDMRLKAAEAEILRLSLMSVGHVGNEIPFSGDLVAQCLRGLASDQEAASAAAVLLARRNSDLLILVRRRGDGLPQVGSPPVREVIDAVAGGHVTRAVLVDPDTGGSRWTSPLLSALLRSIRNNPDEAAAWFENQKLLLGVADELTHSDYFTRLEQCVAHPGLIDFMAAEKVNGLETKAPFDRPERLPPTLPAAPKRRSAVFLHNNYYHFNCLAAGLKSRGWDAITVSVESPDSPQRQFYQGEDILLFDPDPATMRNKIREFFVTVPERFGALHFYGMGLPSFFPENFENSAICAALPWDFLELRRHRTVIGYMPSGCNEGGLQSSIRALTGGVCSTCVWELKPDICNDAKSLAWNRKLESVCDWIGLECDHATTERIGPKSVYGPVVTALDPERWRPDLEIPPEMRIEREPGEVVIYHGVGNYQARRAEGRDIKGTGAVFAAIDSLKAEGLPVRLIFAQGVPSEKVRFLQVQADIVVDQLNYGRYGANAREALMLGKPTICRVSPRQSPPLPPLQPVKEAPLINAEVHTIKDVLREFVLNPARRIELGQKGRAFALAWHSKDVCAERYERVVDRIRAGLLPETSELYPTPLSHANADLA